MCRSRLPRGPKGRPKVLFGRLSHSQLHFSPAPCFPAASISRFPLLRLQRSHISSVSRITPAALFHTKNICRSADSDPLRDVDSLNSVPSVSSVSSVSPVPPVPDLTVPPPRVTGDFIANMASSVSEGSSTLTHGPQTVKKIDLEQNWLRIKAKQAKKPIQAEGSQTSGSGPNSGNSAKQGNKKKSNGSKKAANSTNSLSVSSNSGTTSKTGKPKNKRTKAKDSAQSPSQPAKRLKSPPTNHKKPTNSSSASYNSTKNRHPNKPLDLSVLTLRSGPTPMPITNYEKIGKYVAIDCEFVGVGSSPERSALARVSIVNFHGHVLFDSFVRPTERVVNWRTWVSGVRPRDMRGALSFPEAQRRTAELLKDRILVGHAIRNDLTALKLKHPPHLVRDTSLYTPFKQLNNGSAPGLKKLAKLLFNESIQGGEHSSVEDAAMTMRVYVKFKSDIDAFFAKRHVPLSHCGIEDDYDKPGSISEAK